MFKVAPIGSCRIAGPLRVGQTSHGIDMNLTRCYGYCHSPAEAVQMARFMLGQSSIPDDVWPLVSRSTTSRAGFEAQPLNASDLFVVELASAKELTIDGVSIQLNYLNATYREFFSDTQRAQEFWACASLDDRGAVTRFLEREWSSSAQHREDAATLARIQLRIVDRARLKDAIETLGELLPKVLFVSHIDAAKADGQRINSRSGFISLVREEAASAGFAVFDPTELMGEFGQTNAIEDHSTSLAHFTADFTAAIMDQWMHRVIAPLTDQAAKHGASAALKHQIDADLAHGRHAFAHARLEKLASERAGVASLRKNVAKHRKDAVAVFDELLERHADEQATAPDLASVFDQAVRLGQFATALSLASLPTDEPTGVPNHLLMNAARAAVVAGDPSSAFHFAYAVLKRAEDPASARQLIENLVVAERVPEFANLPESDTRDLLTGLSPELRLAALATQNETIAYAVSSSTSEQELSSLVIALAGQDRIEDAIELMSAWRELAKANRIRHEDLISLLDEWVAAAMALPNPEHRVQAMVAILRADPRHKGLREALQTLKVDFMKRTRAAGNSGDHDAIEALADEAALFPMPLPEYDLWRARLQFGRGEFEEALSIGRAAAQDLPATSNVWVLLMRAAVKLQRQGDASEFASRVLVLARGKSQRLYDEAQGILNAQSVGG